MTKLREFSTAIATMEGFYLKGSVAQRLNNPGNLIYMKQRYATPYNIIGKDGKLRSYCLFPTVETGFRACDFQLSLWASRINLDTKKLFTVQEVIHKWAPAEDGNDPHGYTAFICQKFGCNPSDEFRKVVTD